MGRHVVARKDVDDIPAGLFLWIYCTIKISQMSKKSVEKGTTNAF
jgi:hypothetical protein